MLPHEEEQWFVTAVKPCEPALRAYLARRFPVLGDHEDLMQETYARVLRARRKGQLTSVKAFLFTVARNLALDTFRRRHAVVHEAVTDEVHLPLLEETGDAGVALEHSQRQELLIEAVASLPDRCREVLMLRYLDGMSYKDIGDRLGISPHTVKVHKVRGMRACTNYFRKHGFFEIGADESAAE